MTDQYNLNRFVVAQDPIYAFVVAELKAGHKRTHWMWFVFPQIHGLGRSFMARQYAISGLDEANAYLTHPVLGPRLIECTEAVLGVENRSAAEIFGFPDVLKFHSSLTLYSQVADGPTDFNDALEKFYAAKLDLETLAILKRLT